MAGNREYEQLVNEPETEERVESLANETGNGAAVDDAPSEGTNPASGAPPPTESDSSRRNSEPESGEAEDGVSVEIIEDTPPPPEPRFIKSCWYYSLVLAVVLFIVCFAILAYFLIFQSRHDANSYLPTNCTVVKATQERGEDICSCGEDCSYTCVMVSCVKVVVGFHHEGTGKFLLSKLNFEKTREDDECYTKDSFPPCFNRTTLKPIDSCQFNCFYKPSNGTMEVVETRREFFSGVAIVVSIIAAVSAVAIVALIIYAVVQRRRGRRHN